MPESSCVELLRWALPRLSLAWPGFRRVRRQVCRRIGRRAQELKLPDLTAYRSYLEAHPAEWTVFDSLCRIPISRFFRDREVYDALGAEVLPSLVGAARGRGDGRLRLWSAGCASGEEPYSMQILWSLQLASRFPEVRVVVLATDVDPQLLGRARDARYRTSSLRELPREWVEKAFRRLDGLFELRAEFREGIEFRCEDIRESTPRGPFDLILCRNLVFTYFDAPSQRSVLERVLGELRPSGALVVGRRERVPEGAAGLVEWRPGLPIYRKSAKGNPVGLRGTDELVERAAPRHVG